LDTRVSATRASPASPATIELAPRPGTRLTFTEQGAYLDDPDRRRQPRSLHPGVAGGAGEGGRAVAPAAEARNTGTARKVPGRPFQRGKIDYPAEHRASGQDPVYRVS
jgi:hypothetical protein